MPEGHTLHRLARSQQKMFGGHVIAASSPQGRFAGGAEALDGRLLLHVEAYGKHLFQYYEDAPTLHIHLGLYGKFTTGSGNHRSREARSGSGWSPTNTGRICEVRRPAS